MRSKLLYLLFAGALLGGMALFAWTNPSYQKAFEAKWYYFMGDYDEADRLAKEAYELDPYNRMALTVMTRSEVAKKYLGYIREGHEYLRRIEEIAAKEPVDEADRVRIKMMCEVMMGRYEKLLSSSRLTDEELVARARVIYEKFRDLYDSLFKQK
jgi:tetratricopeptide (TPR) repeat protein